MIDKKKKKQVKKIVPKTKNCPSRPRRPPTMKKSRYSQKYLENRNKMRSKILEKANETFYCELSNLDDRMCIEEEEIVLGAAAADGEHVSDRGVWGADAAGALAGVVDGGGVESEQLVVAAAVEGQVLYLALFNESGGGLSGSVDGFAGGVDFNDLLDGGDAENDVEVQLLALSQRDAGAGAGFESIYGDFYGVVAHWDRWRVEEAFRRCGEGASCAGFKLADFDLRAGDAVAGRVVNRAGYGASDDLGVGREGGEGEDCDGQKREVFQMSHLDLRRELEAPAPVWERRNGRNGNSGKM